MYNKICLGHRDFSILKFYYASFKIQQLKDKTPEVSIFLDNCVKISEDSNFILKIFDVIPSFNLVFGTGKEEKFVAEIIRTKRENIENLFMEDDISDETIKLILYGISPLMQTDSLTQERVIQVVKDKILKCYTIRGRKRLGDRIFGYLLASELISAYAPEDCLWA